MKITTLAALLTISVASLAHGAEYQSALARSMPKHMQIEARFAAADANHDGRLTRVEALVGMPFVAQHFDVIDLQRAGYVTLAQVQMYVLELDRARRDSRAGLLLLSW